MVVVVTDAKEFLNVFGLPVRSLTIAGVEFPFNIVTMNGFRNGNGLLGCFIRRL